MTELTPSVAGGRHVGGSSHWTTFAHVRLTAAVLAFLVGAGLVVWHQVEDYHFASLHRPFQVDPATFFYLAGAAGLALRVFWARYLVICFAAAITSLNVVFGSLPWLSLAAGCAFIGLLSGPTLRGLFEERPSPRNHWASATDPRITRLRLLFIAQSVAIALLWLQSDAALVVTGCACLALAGLTFHRTWAALLMMPVVAVEAYVALSELGQRGRFLPHGGQPLWTYTAVVLACATITFVLIAPFLAAFARKLRA